MKSVILLAVIAITRALYVEESGNPYDDGSLTGQIQTFDLTPQDHGIPMQVRVDYPAIENDVAVVLFMTGWGGFVPPGFYSDYLLQVAAHGFIVISPLTLNGGLDLPATVQWLVDNLDGFMTGSNTVASWGNMGMSCHSAGCADIINLLNGLQDPSAGKAVIMFDPFAFGNSDIDLQIPIAFYGTNASCNVEGLDYISIYNRWQGQKMRTGNELYGHCDIMDNSILDVCRTFCAGGPPADEVEAYRRTVQGMTAAMFIDFLQGRADVIDYLLDPAMIPTPTTEHIIDQW